MKIEIHPVNLALFKAEDALEHVEATGRTVHGAMQRSFDQMVKKGKYEYKPDLLTLGSQWRTLRRRIPDLKVRIIQATIDAESIKNPTPFQL